MTAAPVGGQRLLPRAGLRLPDRYGPPPGRDHAAGPSRRCRRGRPGAGRLRPRRRGRATRGRLLARERGGKSLAAEDHSCASTAPATCCEKVLLSASLTAGATTSGFEGLTVTGRAGGVTRWCGPQSSAGGPTTARVREVAATKWPEALDIGPLPLDAVESGGVIGLSEISLIVPARSRSSEARVKRLSRPARPVGKKKKGTAAGKGQERGYLRDVRSTRVGEARGRRRGPRRPAPSLSPTTTASRTTTARRCSSGWARRRPCASGGAPRPPRAAARARRGA